LHQDDIWLPDRASELRRLERTYPHASLWAHNTWFIDLQDRRVGRFGPPFSNREIVIDSDEIFSSLLIQNTLALPAVMFRRDQALRSGGLDESLWYTADWDLWLRLSREGPMAWLPKFLAGFRLHPNSLTLIGSRNLNSFRQQLHTALDRHASTLHDSQAELKRLAELSAELNISLAELFHKKSLAPLMPMARILALGPAGSVKFLKHTQITQRVVSRLRALKW
jgi:hypothetical protein